MKGLIFNILGSPTRTLGAYRIAHCLREEGWDIEVIDFCEVWELDELQELAKSRIDKDTVFLGFSFLFSNMSERFENYIKWLKVTFPDVLLISGGQVAAQFDTSSFDLHIKGFGELALLEFLRWYKGNGPRPRFDLLSKGCKLIDANKQYPAYPMKSLMVKYEDRDFIDSNEWLTIEFARGCKFKCDFCNFPILGVKGDYSRDAEDARIQLQDSYDRFGVSNYLVSDETFNDRTEKISKFADVVEQLSFRPWFSGFVRADLLISRPRDREELLRMNFLGQYYGIESFNRDAARIVGKGMDPEKIKQGLIDIKNYYHSNGTKLYRGSISLIIGLAKENRESLDNTIRWLTENWSGESFSPFVLEVPIGSFDTKSSISSNYQSYGYRLMKDSDVKRSANLNVGYVRRETALSEDCLKWEHDDLNIVEATQIQDEWLEVRDNPNNKFTVNCFSLSDVGRHLPISEKLKLPQKAIDMSTDWNHPDFKELMANYKFKKLSL
jgi:hypothetical protein